MVITLGLELEAVLSEQARRRGVAPEVLALDVLRERYLTVELTPKVDDSRSLHADRPPLRVDEGGAVRVGNSRISLDLIVEQYENGMTPEDMARAYDTLVLADVYATIAFYLRHRDEVRSYLKRRAGEAGALRMQVEAERPRVTRVELLARRRARETERAPTGQ